MTDKLRQIFLEPVDEHGNIGCGSSGFAVTVDTTTERRDGRETTTLAVQKGWVGKVLFPITPLGKGRPRTITHLRVSGPDLKARLVPLTEPRSFARPGDYRLENLSFEAP